eukprot:XP_014039105.1 PREDICTED: uncharacterized protein LOC106592299 isoform X2 [Salmo salar]
MSTMTRQNEVKIQTNNITMPCRLMDHAGISHRLFYYQFQARPDAVCDPQNGFVPPTRLISRVHFSACFQNPAPLLLCQASHCQASPFEAEYNGSMSVRLRYMRMTVTDSPGAQVRASSRLPPPIASAMMCHEKIDVLRIHQSKVDGKQCRQLVNTLLNHPQVAQLPPQSHWGPWCPGKLLNRSKLESLTVYDNNILGSGPRI